MYARLPVTDPESQLRALVEAGSVDDASSLAIKTYGDELLGFLAAIARDDTVAADAFSLACEAMWTNLATFRFEASVRTWFYQLGRNALHRVRRDPRPAPARNNPLSVMTSIAEVQRAPTAAYRKTESKNALREMRDALAPEDRELLILRLDRNMSWKDIARALASDTDAPSSLDSRAASLRKRFERLKADLREQAVARGIVESDG